MTETTIDPRIRPDPVDDEEFDIRPYLLAVWRSRFVILAITVGCAALAAIATWRQATVYEATARIYVGEPGSTAHAEVLGRMRLLLADPTLALHVFQSLTNGVASPGLTADEFQDAIAPRVSVPPNALLVHVHLGDPAFASRAAQALALRAVEVFREQTRVEREADQAELAKADEAIAAAVKATLDFTVSKRLPQRRESRELLGHNREQLADTLAQIAGERARQKAAQGDSGALAASRAALAGLEAKRDHLSAVIAEQQRAAESLTEDELEQQRLETEVLLARQLRRERTLAVAKLHSGALSRPPLIFETSAPESRDVTPGPTRAIVWSAVFGMVASIVGVILRHAVTSGPARG